MRVVIIGAGSSGLVSAKYIAADGHECEILEMNQDYGGTWFYTGEVGTDKCGFPVYSAMYDNLVTNLPKPIIGYPEFEIPHNFDYYLSQPQMLEYLRLYAEHFNLKPLIRLNRFVTDVRPVRDTKWQVTSIYKPTKETIVTIYDVVMICSGICNEPIQCQLPGRELFHGPQYNSHQYRSPEPFRNQRVLVIGAGPSGLDITLQISRVAKSVTLSHHQSEPFDSIFQSNVQKRPDALRVVNDEEVEFIDGTRSGFDIIMYCTGYRMQFPFLHETCNVTVDENYVQPVYNHMIHIERPTLCFIGIVSYTCVFVCSDTQARYYAAYLRGDFKLPSTELMHKETEREMQRRWGNGYSKRKAHYMSSDQITYLEGLANEAHFKPPPSVISKIFDENLRKILSDFVNFRKERYKILDDDNFVNL